jgi:hypothetical protein
MPLAVIDGALSTHPIIRARDTYSRNAFYDITVRSLREADPATVTSKLEQLNVPSCHRREPPSIESRDRSRDS